MAKVVFQADAEIVQATHKYTKKADMFQKYIKNFISLLPVGAQNSIWALWHIIYPPRIRLYEYETTGCVFETPTKMERYRISSFGDEKEFISQTLAAIGKDDVFFDIGSNLGLYAIHAAKKGARVFAFEPDPGYLKRLKRNIKLNKFPGMIKVVDWAVSDKEGTLQLFTDGVEGNSPSLVQFGARGSVTVKANSIDNAIHRREIPIPAVVKIDIEGAEVLALKGMADTLCSPASPHFIFIEIHPIFLEQFGSSAEECKQLLKSFGYVEVSSMIRQNQIHAIYKKAIASKE